MSKDSYKISNALIDTAGFAAGNYLLAGPASIAKPDLAHIAIFALSDMVGRNFVPNAVSNLELAAIVDGKSMKSTYFVRNGYVSLIYLGASAVLDMTRGDSAKKSIMDNLIRAAVGLGTNTAIDYVVPAEYQ